MRNKIRYIAAFFVLFPLLLHAQQTWYVSSAGSGTKDGSSWENASGNLMQTVSSASPHDAVWVAAGVYYGGFTMKDGVQVYGGFSGVETSLAQRKLPGSGQNLTILDGAYSFRVLTQPESFTNPTVWDGFIIRNGQSMDGGGVYLRNNGILRRVIVHHNFSGSPAVGEYNQEQGGVVFRIDNENRKAWVIATENYGANYQMGVEGSNPKNELSLALADMNGQNNTESLSGGRAVQVLKKYRAESPAHTHTDWYLPSAGEWALFISDSEQNKHTAIFDKVEETLVSNNKTPLSGQRYWSSTTAVNNNMASAWHVNFATNDINTLNVWQYNKVRGVRSFNFTSDNGKGGAVFALTGSRVEGCLIYDNIGALGYAVCARGSVDIVNSTIAGNKSETSQVTSYAIDANSGVRLLNTIVTNNFNASNLASNHDSDITYQFSAVETAESLPTGNIKLGNVNEANGAGFVNITANNFQLQNGSVCALSGSVDLIPAGLDTDIAGNARVSSNGVSVGAYEPSTVSGLGNIPALYVNIYPNPVVTGGLIHVDIQGVAENNFTIEIYDMLGMKHSTYTAQQQSSIFAPQIPGVYIVRIATGNKAYKDYKLIVH